jgi:SAM-dependent methyltransferase
MTATAFSLAAERNKAPILEVLREVLPGPARVLEIASGTGQHAAHFCAARPDWDWQPTDTDPAALPGIAAQGTGLPNQRAPLRLDVLAAPWPVPPAAFDAVYCANLIHIAPWSCSAALLHGAARHLRPAAVLVLYGPYLVDGEAAAASNLAFDADLRTRNPAWGLRRLDEVLREARAAGFALERRVAMPANNLTLVLRRVAAG